MRDRNKEEYEGEGPVGKEAWVRRYASNAAFQIGQASRHIEAALVAEMDKETRDELRAINGALANLEGRLSRLAGKH